jgi:hypothetical protein
MLCLAVVFCAGVVYKVLQRTLRYGGQPVIFDWLQSGSPPGEQFKKTLLTQALSGSAVGLLEVALLPIDTLKIKHQTLSAASLQQQRTAIMGAGGGGGSSLTFAQRLVGLPGTIQQLYRGAGWTAARNMPGQFALFGGNSLAKSAMGIEATATGATRIHCYMYSRFRHPLLRAFAW